MSSGRQVNTRGRFGSFPRPARSAQPRRAARSLDYCSPVAVEAAALAHVSQLNSAPTLACVECYPAPASTAPQHHLVLHHTEDM